MALADWARGIDVSYANGSTPNLRGRAFVFVRATYGTSPDSLWDFHSANVRKAGAILGAYAFGVVGDGAVQARAFLDVAGTADLFALDLEKESGKPRMTLAQAKAFISTVQASGRKVGLYHSVSGFPALGQDWNWPAGGPGWDNQTTGSFTPPSMKWAFWQYRGFPLDLDYFHGDEAALARFVRPPDDGAPTHRLHLAQDATVRVYRLTGGAIAGWEDWTWDHPASSAPCEAPVRRVYRKTTVLTTRVLSGAFTGQVVRASGSGVSVTTI